MLYIGVYSSKYLSLKVTAFLYAAYAIFTLPMPSSATPTLKKAIARLVMRSKNEFLCFTVQLLWSVDEKLRDICDWIIAILCSASSFASLNRRNSQ